MELIKNHIESYLNSFIGDNELDSNLFINIDNYSKKNRFIKLLKYVDKLIEFKSDNYLNSVNTLHIHFENEFNQELEIIIFQLIIAKLFNSYQSAELSSTITDIQNTYLIAKINELQQKYNEIEYRCPEGASAKNGGNRIYKKWVNRKIELRCLLTFFNSINANSNFSNKALINCKVGIKNQILEMYKLSPLAIDIKSSDYELYYCLLNTEYSLNDIDQKFDILDSTENIILFDCETKKVMSNYSLDELIKWNNDYGTNFKKCLIITFGNGTNSIKKTKDKIQKVQERFKIKVDDSYTFLLSELNMILKKKTKKINVEFVGFEYSSFWDTFLIETSIRELYELRSIKLMNVYSLCLDEKIKNYIIEDLFSKNETSKLISLSTKQSLLELRDEDIGNIKDALVGTLDSIINAEIKSRIIELLDSIPTIVFDETILRNSKLISIFSKSTGIGKSIKLKPWSESLNLTSVNILILSYRDQGKYPNYYFPNLIEFECQNETTAKAILPNFLFGNHYKWSKYYLLKDYHKYLSHPIRQTHFEWNKLKNAIQTLKPESKLKIDWNLENDFSNSEHRETYKIKIKKQRAKTFYNSDLFIVSDENKLTYKVVKIDFLCSFEIDDDNVFIQSLDEIQENINIYEKIADTKQQEKELDIIRKQFNLGDESAGRLWKILLKNISEREGEEKLYNDLRIHFESKGLKIVSLFHFKNSWINPQSESIAPLSKRVFIELCEYLKIPKIYFVIIQRIRNASKQSSRQSTRQMNHLLTDLFNDGCFDNDKNAREIINNKLSYYKLNHPLDELGIDEYYLADNLVTLTELIQPELKLLELETIEKIEQ